MMYKWRNALPPWSTAEHGPWTMTKCHGYQQLVNLLIYELDQAKTVLPLTAMDLTKRDGLQAIEQAIEVETNDRTRRMMLALKALLA